MRQVTSALAVVLAAFVIFPGCEKDEPTKSNTKTCSDASPYNAAHRWTSSEWDPAFYYDSSIPDIWKDEIWYGAARWNDVKSRFKIYYYKDEVSAGDSRDGKNVVSWGYFAGEALGKCHSWYNTSTGRVIEADIVLNKKYDLSSDVREGHHHVGSIATHEFGHFCGLDHVSDKTQIMDGGGLRPNTRHTSLCGGDRKGLLALYGAR